MADTGTVTLTGTLKTSGGTPLASQPVTFTDSLGTSIPGATTDASGNFSVPGFSVAAPTANYTATASFAGVAGQYNASSATSTPVNITANTNITISVTVS